MKRTYKITEIASKIGKNRATVVEWSNHFREFLPTIAVGRSMRYSEEAIDIFQIISKMKDANKPHKFIKEHLQEMRQKVFISLQNEEKPLLSTPTIGSDANLPLAINKSSVPPAVNKSNLPLSKETMELRNMVLLLTQKIEANKAQRNEKDHNDDLNQKVGISSIEGDRFLSPIKDHSNSPFIQLTNEVTELNNIIHTLTQKVIEVSEQTVKVERITSTVETLNRLYSGVSEEVTELRNVVHILAQKVTEVFEQDIRNEFASKIDLLNRQIEGVSVEATGLRNVIQTVQQKVTEVSEQDFKGDTELLNQRYESVSEDVKELLHTQKETDKRYDDISEEVTELRNVIQILAQKVSEMVEQDVSGELQVREEALNKRIENISEEVARLGHLIQTKELLNRRNDDISEQLISQQRLLDKIAKFLGYQVIN